MFRRYYTSILGAILILVAVGCSNSNSPSAPGLEKAGLETERETGSASNHFALGSWQFTADPVAKTLEVAPLRDGNFHLNALIFLEPAPPLNITLGNLKFDGNIIDVDVGLRHPLVGFPQFTGFDVCGILITNGSVTGFSNAGMRMAGPGDTRLLNPDGYSRWWNPAEFPVNLGTMFSYNDGAMGTPDSLADYNCTLNGYKYFADELGPTDPLANLSIAGRGVFTTGKKNIRHYKIELGTDGLIFNYAVDACWKMPFGKPPYTIPDAFPEGANRPEAWNSSVKELENTLYYSGPNGSTGGNLKLLVDVYDHFNAALNKVSAESLSGLPLTSALTPIGGGEGYSTYQLDFTGGSLTKNGDAELLITVESEAVGYGGILPGKPVSAYFIWPFNIYHHPAGTAWARTWGGIGSDEGFGVAIDGSGNTYITGHFYDTVDFNPGPGVDEHTSNGIENIFLSKFNSNGEFQWARTWGGTGYNDTGYGIAVDAGGNAYITGYFDGTADFDPGPGVDEHTAKGLTDIFLTKLDSNGEFQWARTWGGEDFYGDGGHGAAIDGSSCIYIAGSFGGTVDFDPGPGVDEHTSKGGGDIFLSKFDSNGEFLWARTWGGGNIFADFGNGVTIDGTGNAYVMGGFWGNVDFDPGPGVDKHKSNGAMDLFLSKLDSNGEFQWARTWGGVNLDKGYGVAIDGSGNAYITGYFQSTVDFDPGAGVDEHAANGYNDIFLSKVDSNGEFQWARTWGGVNDDQGGGVAIDGSGNAYVTGTFFDAIDFDPGPGVDEHAANGYNDIFLTKFDSNGGFLWARTWGWDNMDEGNGVATDGSGNAYITGNFCGDVDFDPGPAVDEHTSNGNYDIFLSKFPPDGNW